MGKMTQYKGRGGWRGGGRPEGTKRPENRKDVHVFGQRWSNEEGTIIKAYLKKHKLTQKKYLALKVEEDMLIPEIAKELLETSEVVHDAENIELQNWTNTLSDEQINSLWGYASKKNLKRYSEKANGVTIARFIAKSELERLIDG